MSSEGEAAGTLALPAQRDEELLARLVAGRSWFHTIDLGGGVITPGVDDSWSKLQLIRLPESFAGKTVLDVGAFDGYFSFEAERRGAARVVAADEFCWSRPGDPMTDGQGFDIAHWARQSRVEKRRIPVEDISPETVGVFDYVLFLGVLYHSPDPLRYLRNVRSVCREQLILETHVDALEQERPMMVFYPGTSLNGDASNHWGPNRQCVVEMLKEVGFRRVELVSHAGSRMAFHAFP
ncbi:MAG TPA: methyltransferase domain-containing protein [Acidimicrobiales bacterium]|nr:methyltransferase domain-containing protein [Acidimicrobiales bacterium]